MTDEPRARPLELRALANVTPLRRIKVLVDGPDHAHVEAVSAYLEQRGYDAKHGNRSGPLEAESDGWPDVVVLFEGESFGDTVGRAVALIGRSDAVRVIVATSRRDAPSAPRLRFVADGSPLDALALAIERTWAHLP